MRSGSPFGWPVLLLATALAAPSQAGLMWLEDFESDGSGSRYSVVGGGGSGGSFWGLQSSGSPLGFTGAQGADFWAGRDLDGVPGGGEPRELVFPFAGSIGLVGPGPTVLSILWAANAGGYWDAGQDYLRLYLVDLGGGSGETLIEEFLPNGAGDLESTIVAGRVLGPGFQPAVYALPGSVTQGGLRFEMWSTGAAEYVGFDQIAISSPEPDTLALLLAGLVVLGLRSRAQ